VEGQNPLKTIPGWVEDIVIGYKVIDIVGFNAKYCVVIKFCFNSLFCGRYYSYSFF
jgi:hypothetical protein